MCQKLFSSLEVKQCLCVTDFPSGGGDSGLAKTSELYVVCRKAIQTGEK